MTNRFRAALFAIAAVAMSSAALAHTHLVASTPAANASVAKPTTISLSFNEKVMPAFSGADVVMTGMPGMANHQPMKLSGLKSNWSADGKTLTLVAGTTTRHFVGYLDGVSNGYLLESGGNHGAAGLLEAQVAGPYNSTIPGLFIGGTQFAQDAGPMVLLPAVHFSAGSFSASQGSGYYAMDAASGRGLGTISITGLGSAIFVVYQVAPDRVRTMRFGTISRSGTVEWYGH